ncbi:MAG: L-2-amino-thiazoline-4-carboxylic acid hydrolase, partial [Candidatus Heimdallarchaeota archaeon]|nr:L-2-amino-thiazoline-4-carboxylic acid hydrolase [Candidatus Heimdallarchaeota archaeon]
KMYEKSLSTQSFLAALKANLDHETAFKIAKDAFSRYMVKIYADVLKGTDENSIERFDKFRAFYEEYAKKTPYLEIIESTKTKLKVKYTRCPFYEVLVDEKLEDLAYTFCLSDSVFTAKVLPGVKFSREKEIVRNDKYCDHTWEFIKK